MRLSKFKTNKSRNQLRRTCTTAAFAALLVGSRVTVDAADQTWSGGTSGNGTSFTASSNWVGGAAPGSTSLTTNTDIASIGSSGTNPGITFTSASNQNYYLGTIDFSSASRTIGVSTGGVTETLQLNGATVNLVPNVILRNSGSGVLTLQNGTGTLSLVLGNATDNVINIEGSGGIIISSLISGAGKHLTLGGGGAGAGALTLSGANTFTGGMTVGAGILQVGAASTLTGNAITSSAIGSGTLTLGAGSTLRSDGATARTINNNLSLAGAITLGAAATQTGTLAFDNTALAAPTATLTADTTLNLNVAVSIADALSGGFALTKNGVGVVLTLSGANSFTGAFTVGSGSVSVASIGNSGANSNLGTNATVNLGSTTAVGTLTYTGTGETSNKVLNLNGTTFGGIITQSGTNLLKFTSDLTATGSGIKTLTLQGSTAGTGEISGKIVDSAAGATSLTKAGTGTWTLSGANTYTGATLVSLGTLRLGLAGALPSTTALTVGVAANTSASIFDLANFNQTVGSLQLFGGASTAANSGAVTLGTGILTVNGPVSYDTATGGRYPSAISGAGALDLGGATRAFAIYYNVNNSVGDLQITSVIQNGGINKSQTGALLLGAANTYGLGTTVTAGSVLLGTSSVASGGVVTSGPVGTGLLTLADTSSLYSSTTTTAGDRLINNNLSLSGGITLGNATNTGVLTFNNTGLASPSATLTAATTLTIASAVNIADVISGGSFGLVKVGTNTLTLSGANTYTGLTDVQAGTLAYGASNVTADAASLKVSGGTLDLKTFSDTVTGVQLTSGTIASTTGVLTSTTAYDLQAGTVSAILGGSVAANKTTTGIVTLSGANTYSGGTSLTAGTIYLGSNSVVASGAVTSGPVGTGLLTIGTGTTLASNAVTTAGDRTISNNLSLGGAITIGNATNTGILTFDNRGLTSPSSVLTADTALTMTGSATVFNVLSGVGRSLSKAGAGYLEFVGANTFSGSYTNSAGNTYLDVNGALGNVSSVIISGGTLTSAFVGLTDQINDAAPVVTSGAGKIDFSGNTETIGSLSGSSTGSPGLLIGDYTNTATPPVTFSGSLTVGGNNTDTAYSGVIAGVRAAAGALLTKTGTGTFTLSGANTFTGSVLISTGTLKLGAAGGATNTPLGTTAAGTTVGATGAALDLGGFTLGTAEPLTLNGTGISNAGALTNSGAGASTYSGLVTLGSAATVASNSGNILLTNTGTITGSGFGLTLAGSNAASSVTSVIGTGTGTLTKTGSGTWTLLGATSNTYTGLTTVSQGSLVLGKTVAGANAIGGDLLINGGTVSYVASPAINEQIADASNVTLSSGTFDLAARTETVNSLTMTGGALNKASTALTLSSASSITGGTVTFSVAASQLNANGTLALGGATFSYANAAANTGGLVLGGNVSYASTNTAPTVFSNTLAGVGKLDLGGATRTFDIAAASPALANAAPEVQVGWSVQNGGLTKAGTGTLQLSAANTYAGGTTVSNGTLNVNTGGTLGATTGALTVSAATGVTSTLNVNASQTVGSLAGTVAGTGVATVNLASGTTLTSSQTGSSQFDGALASSGGLTKAGAGTLTLTGGNTYTGTTTISGGALALGSGGTTGSLSAASAIVDNANLTVNRSNAVAQGTDFSTAAITGTGSFTQAGTGATTLNAANTYSGGTLVSTGSLVVSNANGTSATGTGAVTVSSTGTLLGTGFINTGNTANTVTIGGTLSPGTTGTAGTINIKSTATTGALTLSSGSTLAFDITNGNPTLMDLVALAGSSLAINNATLALNLSNFDEAAYGATYTVFSGVNGLTGSFGSITGYDAGTYQAQLNLNNGNYDLSFTPVPEPATVLGGLLTAGLVGYRGRRRLRGLLGSRRSRVLC